MGGVEDTGNSSSLEFNSMYTFVYIGDDASNNLLVHSFSKWKNNVLLLLDELRILRVYISS